MDNLNPQLSAGLLASFHYRFLPHIPRHSPSIRPQFPQSTQLPANLPYWLFIDG
ncbi:hypothetical protein [Xenorhabdus bovienii]|uniref:hypothetical protein n=1 Tax=Xenorhabdus bovienii TaxID=40576 RepID=UPI003DA5A8FC